MPVDKSNISINQLYKSITLQSILRLNPQNIKIGGKEILSEFDKSDVSKEFNADWGATSSFSLPKKKEDNTKFCIVLSLFKKDKGLIIVYYLFENPSTDLSFVEKNFNSLKFKK